MKRNGLARNKQNRYLRNDGYIKWPGRRVCGYRTHSGITLMSLAAGMTGRHHRRSAFLRHLQAAIVFCLSHGPQRNQASDGRRRGPKNRYHQHCQSTCSGHRHSVSLSQLSSIRRNVAGRSDLDHRLPGNVEARLAKTFDDVRGMLGVEPLITVFPQP